MRKNSLDMWEYLEYVSKNEYNNHKIAECITGLKFREQVKITSSETTGMIFHLQKKHNMFVN